MLWSLAVIFSLTVSAHMQLRDPLPIRSPLNPHVLDPDYSYKNPLAKSGSDFPCKGYQHDPFTPSATYVPGESYELHLDGVATHGGGSCQVSLSLDEGQTFRVINSILGNCPSAGHYQFVIPLDTPPGPALLGWTWFNRLGNREMYMNCAQVLISDALRPSHSRPVSPRLAARDPLQSLPSIFIANVNGPGQCATIEGQAVRFPLPGAEVEGTTDGPGFVCQDTAPFLVGAHGESKGATAHGPWASSPSNVVTSTASSSASTSPESTPPGSTGSSWACQDGSLVCSIDGGTFSICDHGQLKNMGSVAPGTQCRDGRVISLSRK